MTKSSKSTMLDKTVKAHARVRERYVNKQAAFALEIEPLQADYDRLKRSIESAERNLILGGRWITRGSMVRAQRQIDAWRKEWEEATAALHKVRNKAETHRRSLSLKDHDERAPRACMTCGNQFMSDHRFQRMCPTHRANTGGIA